MCRADRGPNQRYQHFLRLQSWRRKYEELMELINDTTLAGFDYTTAQGHILLI